MITLLSGGGLSINGKHIYCGDYIFSGHTMTLTMAYLTIKQCTPLALFFIRGLIIDVLQTHPGGSSFSTGYPSWSAWQVSAVWWWPGDIIPLM